MICENSTCEYRLLVPQIFKHKFSELLCTHTQNYCLPFNTPGRLKSSLSLSLSTSSKSRGPASDILALFKYGCEMFSKMIAIKINCHLFTCIPSKDRFLDI